MVIDIVATLRQQGMLGLGGLPQLCREAADEIERLRKENEELKRDLELWVPKGPTVLKE